MGHPPLPVSFVPIYIYIHGDIQINIFQLTLSLISLPVICQGVSLLISFIYSYNILDECVCVKFPLLAGLADWLTDWLTASSEKKLGCLSVSLVISISRIIILWSLSFRSLFFCKPCGNPPIPNGRVRLALPKSSR